MIDNAKQEYHRGKLENADTKTIFKSVNHMLNKDKSIYPSHESAQSLANEFAAFFENKIKTIYQGFDQGTAINTRPSPSHGNDVPCLLSEFDILTEADVLQAIMMAPTKSCSLDPMPTWFLKENVPPVLPIITNIINQSLSTGLFPECLETAIITPTIKKASLDPNTMRNYRPVSNIPFLSKLIEKQVVKVVNEHIVNYNLGDELQSAYKSAHCTETALLKVKNDIMHSLSLHRGVFLVLLDLSSAFDTVNHDLLVKRMATDLGLGGTVIRWFKSYLSGRTSRVCIDGTLSEPTQLTYGLPQGSIVGPSSFTVYTLPLGKIINTFGLCYHMYADDVQIYTSFDPKNPGSITSSLNTMSTCIDSIKAWMHDNYLKLNDSKTEFFVATSPYFKRTMSPVALRVGDAYISPSDTIRNLGVMFDSTMSMSAQVKSLCNSLTYQLRNITRLRRFLDFDTCHLIIRALVLSRLDYGNGLLLGCNATDVSRLQRKQNWAAKLVCMASKYDRASPCLRRLHWLTVETRITFKVLVIVYKCIDHSAPSYLAESLTQFHPGRAGLRSACDTSRLSEPFSRKSLKSADRRSFSYTAPRI